MGRKSRAVAIERFAGSLLVDDPGARRTRIPPAPYPGVERHPGRVVHDCAHCEVRQLGICGAVEEADLPHISTMATDVALSPGSRLFEEGDHAQSVFNVAAGTLRLFRVLPDGRRQITAFGFTGDFLGLFARGVYPFTAEAVDHVRLCRFPAPGMWNLLEKFPALERRFLEMRADELVAAQDRMVLLGRKTPLEKTATFLEEVSLRQQRRGQPSSPVSLSMTRGDIADYLGLTVETVSRCFTRLRVDRVIGLPDPATVRICNPRRLDAIASGY